MNREGKNSVRTDEWEINFISNIHSLMQWQVGDSSHILFSSSVLPSECEQKTSHIIRANCAVPQTDRQTGESSNYIPDTSVLALNDNEGNSFVFLIISRLLEVNPSISSKVKEILKKSVKHLL